MFLSFSVKLVNLLNTIVCLFLLVSIKVLSLLFLFILMCGALHGWFLYLVISGFVSFIDDFSRTTWVYLLKDKSDVFSVFQMFHKMIQTQFNTSIKIVRSDNGGEYMSGDLRTYFREHGIIHQTTCVDTPQQNGVAERKNRHLLKVTRSLMLDMHVPKSYWGMPYSPLHISSIGCPLVS
jgi:hypothetical protein